MAIREQQHTAKRPAQTRRAGGSPWQEESAADTRSEDVIPTDDEVDSPPLIPAARATLASQRGG
jgi:hypothetical protein